MGRDSFHNRNPLMKQLDSLKPIAFPMNPSEIDSLMGASATKRDNVICLYGGSKLAAADIAIRCTRRRYHVEVESLTSPALMAIMALGRAVNLIASASLESRIAVPADFLSLGKQLVVVCPLLTLARAIHLWPSKARRIGREIDGAYLTFHS